MRAVVSVELVRAAMCIMKIEKKKTDGRQTYRLRIRMAARSC